MPPNLQIPTFRQRSRQSLLLTQPENISLCNVVKRSVAFSCAAAYGGLLNPGKDFRKRNAIGPLAQPREKLRTFTDQAA
jgi:hypothetical protein